MYVRVKKLSDRAFLPTRGSDEAAGLDLYAAEALTIAPRSRALVPTDIAISIPMGTFAHILPRSGLAVKYGIHVGAGVVDSDYRGNVGVLLFNHSDEEFVISAGDRIAQMVIKPCLLMSVQESDTLEPTGRGIHGFGSTGV